MLAQGLSSKETITLCWEMPDDAWSHWQQGRGEKSVRDIILEGIDDICKNPVTARERCKVVAQEVQSTRDADQHLRHKIEIQLPASDWGEAFQLIGTIDGDSIRTSQLLAALILESESWKQSGTAEAEFAAGWNEDSLISSLASLTATTVGLSLGSDERTWAQMVAWAAAVGAVAAVASAIAAWCNP